MRQALPGLAVLSVLAATALSGCYGENPPTPEVEFNPTVSDAGRVVQVSVVRNVQVADRFEWDLDGDGALDDGDGESGQNVIFQQPGVHTVTVAQRRTQLFFAPNYPVQKIDYVGYDSGTIEVRPPPGSPTPPKRPPTASFTTDANPGYTERPVRFDASASADQDGPIASYEWDFDGNGTSDRTTDQPRTSHAYSSAGNYQAVLRVKDTEGETALTSRAVPIVDGVPPEGLQAAASGSPFELTLSGRLLDTGDLFLNRGALLQVGLTARGSMKFAKLPGPLARHKSARWATKLTTRQTGSGADTRLRAEGHLLLALGRDRLCLAGNVGGKVGAPVAGRMRVVGGSGAAAWLRGSATVSVPASAESIKGRLALKPAKRALTLPRPCRSVVRVLRAR